MLKLKFDPYEINFAGETPPKGYFIHLIISNHYNFISDIWAFCYTGYLSI